MRKLKLILIVFILFLEININQTKGKELTNKVDVRETTIEIPVLETKNKEIKVEQLPSNQDRKPILFYRDSKY